MNKNSTQFAQQANSPRPQPAKKARLVPTLMMIFTLVVMALCALPNLYPEQNTLVLSALNNQLKSDGISEITAPMAIKTALEQQGFAVNRAKHTSQSIEFLLAEPSQNAAALSWLQHNYATQFTSKIVSQATSPKWLQALGLAPIKLGLDLNGGVLFVLEVDTTQALREQLQSVEQQAKSVLRSEKIRGVTLTIDDATPAEGKVMLGFNAQPTELNTLISQLKHTFTGLSTKQTEQSVTLFFTPDAIQTFHQQVMLQAISTLRGRISELGITEAVTQRQGSNKIRVELPGVQDPTAAKRIIGATASLDFHALQEIGGKRFTMEDGSSISLNPKVILSGQYIKGAQSSRDEMGKPAVQLQLDAQGGKLMAEFSKHNIGNPMATVFSEYFKDANGNSVKKSKVINVATINSALGARFSITNMQSPQAAQELALLLRAGSLITPVTIVHQQTIGPSLGKANIENGFAALALGIAITFAFMALWYRRLGMVANTVLLLNLICLIGLMSLLPGAVLTLPGIAGLVLTIGMAVDTNVIIFERIKEERALGRSPMMALEAGYNKAFHSIVDANITTLLTAVILYSIGYGPIKGFALTLGLGILTSMFTGVFVAKALSYLVYRPRQSRTI
ncbi:protein translocase subunit SecD [Pseudoalteromonas tunicata]|uniref:Protein translocase subunit SecD n=1 Tax=Pseudoalteromonas tunicata D2 TaxID=87626 RepID=A4CAW8_9GAMM|nr:preprotein translocase subunit SecD [Pseudoalteromonas tunicata]AXT30709.1 protein translocase subunit SecD [Pseudoalteromonas tunicata]EAR28526.1 preprotein translocase subunit SecD [Pseudoalteromonas tunicata D2]